MSRFRKLICGLLSASMCMQSTALGKGRLENFNKTSSGQLNARKRKLKAKLNGKVSSDRFIGSSCAKNEKENFDQLTENLQGHGKVISFEKIGGNVKLFFQDGTVRIVSFSLLSVLPLSVITYLGIKWLYSYLLEYRIRRNLDIFLKNKDRETALQYLNSIRDYLCARKGVDPNCEFTPCKKMNEKYIFSPGDAFAYAEIQEKGISKDLIRAIVVWLAR